MNRRNPLCCCDPCGTGCCKELVLKPMPTATFSSGWSFTETTWASNWSNAPTGATPNTIPANSEVTLTCDGCCLDYIVEVEVLDYGTDSDFAVQVGPTQFNGPDDCELPVSEGGTVKLGTASSRTAYGFYSPQSAMTNTYAGLQFSSFVQAASTVDAVTAHKLDVRRMNYTGPNAPYDPNGNDLEAFVFSYGDVKDAWTNTSIGRSVTIKIRTGNSAVKIGGITLRQGVRLQESGNAYQRCLGLKSIYDRYTSTTLTDWWETYNEWPGLGNPATASDYFYRPQRTSVNSSVETYVTGGQTFVAEDEYTTSRQDFLGTNQCPNDLVNNQKSGTYEITLDHSASNGTWVWPLYRGAGRGSYLRYPAASNAFTYAIATQAEIQNVQAFASANNSDSGWDSFYIPKFWEYQYQEPHAHDCFAPTPIGVINTSHTTTGNWANAASCCGLQDYVEENYEAYPCNHMFNWCCGDDEFAPPYQYPKFYPSSKVPEYQPDSSSACRVVTHCSNASAFINNFFTIIRPTPFNAQTGVNIQSLQGIKELVEDHPSSANVVTTNHQTIAANSQSFTEAGCAVGVDSFTRTYSYPAINRQSSVTVQHGYHEPNDIGCGYTNVHKNHDNTIANFEFVDNSVSPATTDTQTAASTVFASGYQGAGSVRPDHTAGAPCPNNVFYNTTHDSKNEASSEPKWPGPTSSAAYFVGSLLQRVTAGSETFDVMINKNPVAPTAERRIYVRVRRHSDCTEANGSVLLSTNVSCSGDPVSYTDGDFDVSFTLKGTSL